MFCIAICEIVNSQDEVHNIVAEVYGRLFGMNAHVRKMAAEISEGITDGHVNMGKTMRFSRDWAPHFMSRLTFNVCIRVQSNTKRSQLRELRCSSQCSASNKCCDASCSVRARAALSG
jgi:hypothetical protein